MPNDENAVIRYLMNEMDPSQEVLMERAMMEDDDLLIEVESLRQTMRRLDDLPHKKPPEELTDSIIEQAAAHQKKWYHRVNVPTEAYKYAAVLLLGMGISSGLWMVYGTSDNTQTDSPESASIEAMLPGSLQNVSTDEPVVEPWVDRNNVLYFQDIFNPQATTFQGIREASLQKLTPLDKPAPSSVLSPNLQLTGSQ